MYAVIKTGGKQYKVASEEVLPVELLHAPVGSVVEFPVLMVGGPDQETRVGAPYLEDVKVRASVINECVRGKKLKIIKFRRRKHSRKQMGHRQSYTTVKIVEIYQSGLSNGN